MAALLSAPQTALLRIARTAVAPRSHCHPPPTTPPLSSYLDMLERMTRIQRQRELRRLAAEGGELPVGVGAGAGAGAVTAEPAPLLTFTPSYELSELARPHDRRGVPTGTARCCTGPTGCGALQCHLPESPARAVLAAER